MAQGVLTEKQELRLQEIKDQLKAIGAEHTGSWDALMIHFHDEVRPNRGCTINVVYVDSDFIGTAFIDPYGNGPFSWGYVDWVHNDSDDECECNDCVAFRAEEEEEDSEALFFKERFGDFFTAETVSEKLNILVQDVEQKTESNLLLCVETSDGKKVYPALQFDDQDSIKGLPEILQILLPSSDSWTALYWLTAQLDDFGGRNAVSVLRGGDKGEIESVFSLAQGDAAGWSDVKASAQDKKWKVVATSGKFGVLQNADGSRVIKKNCCTSRGFSNSTVKRSY